MKVRFLWMLLLLSPLFAHSTELKSGEQLFNRHCVSCHGTEGNGGVGVPLSLPSFINSVSDNYLRKTIRYGRPGRVMPTFSELSDEQIVEIVKYMRSWTGNPGMTFTARKRIKGSAIKGKALYEKHCIHCHQENGKGGSGTGVTFSRPRDLPVIAPSLNNPGFLNAVEDEMIYHTLANGREGTPMVSFKKLGLSDQDLKDIVKYIRGFEAGPYANVVLSNQSPVIIYESSYSLEETVENVKRSALGKNFRIIRTQLLDQGLVAPGKEDKNQVIIYFCNFSFLNKALALDPRVGMFLPCRVTVIKDGDTVKVMTSNPLSMSSLFNNAELNEACKELYDIYTELLEEATL